MKSVLENKIFDSIVGFQSAYDYVIKQIRFKKDEFGISGITIVLEDDFYPECSKVFKQILADEILYYINEIESEYSATFVSMKMKKNKENELVGINIDFDGGNIPVLKQHELIRDYHLKEDAQKIPDNFQIYEERLDVVGIQYRKETATKFVEQKNQWLEFECEPSNKHDSNAIKILGCYNQDNNVVKLHVGYVPAEVAKVVTAFSASECRVRLLKTYVGESGFVEILFQILGPKGRIEEYARLYH